MKRRHQDFRVWFKEVIQDPELKAEYDRQEPEFAVIRAIIDARIKNEISQKDLAIKMGTTQSVISRLESGNANPSIRFLQRMAEALNSNLKIQFVKA